MSPNNLFLRSGFMGRGAEKRPKFAHFGELTGENPQYEDSMAEHRVSSEPFSAC